MINNKPLPHFDLFKALNQLQQELGDETRIMVSEKDGVVTLRVSVYLDNKYHYSEHSILLDQIDDDKSSSTILNSRFHGLIQRLRAHIA